MGTYKNENIYAYLHLNKMCEKNKLYKIKWNGKINIYNFREVIYIYILYIY